MLVITKLPLFFILSFLSSSLCRVQLQSDCTSPHGETGICIPISDCPALLKLVKENISTKDRNFLKASHCGSTDNSSYKVCCAINDTQCFNPDGNLGQCVDYFKCPTITNLLKSNISSESMNFIRNSRCEGPAKYSVCCGPDHTVIPNAHDRCDSSPAPPDPRTQCCGLDNSIGNKIYGGIPVAIDQYPWLTLIEYASVSNNMIKLLCGGTLISSKYVLTAGHCVHGAILKIGKPKNVRLGEYNKTNSGPDCVIKSNGGEVCTDGPVIIPIEKSIPHRDYDPLSVLRRNDIALIRMKNNAPITNFIQPICLPTSDITLSEHNLPLYVAGWGAVSASESSSIKLHVQLPYKTLEQCQVAYNTTKLKLELWKGQICAGGENGKDSCKGDSGGPLMSYIDETTYIVGVVSFGPTPCGFKDVPGVYTNVYEYMPWIRTNIKP